MERLSNRQEIRLLKELKNPKKYKFLDSGSSRLIFSSLSENKVVKLAVGLGALRQNQAEVDAYRDFGDSHIFATIFKYGNYLEVMERVIPVAEQDEYFYDTLERLHKSGNTNMRLIDDVHESADEILGETEDNNQIGLTKEGRFVLYDYGFKTGQTGSNIGDADSLNLNKVNTYIDALCDAIENKRPSNRLDALVKPFRATY